MTEIEACKKMIEQDGYCDGVECSDCPVYNHINHHCHQSFASYHQRLPWLKYWLQQNGGTMNKSEAIKRLDAIEKEQAELRKIIEKSDKIFFDRDVIYIALHNGNPYYMAGEEDGGFCFYRILDTESSYAPALKTGQECLDYHVNAGFNIHVFDNTKEALQFFIDHL